MFSQPPVNAHAANIIAKIKDYLNTQVLDMYTKMSNKMCDDLCLTIDETKEIAT